MNKKITKRDVDSYTYEGGWDVRWDGLITGFGVRIYPSGKKTYVLSYRNEKRQKRLLVLGQTNKITLDHARDLALKHLAAVADKTDPAEVKKLSRTGRSVEKVFEEYLSRHVKENNRTWEETERLFRKDVIPALGEKLIQDVEKQDIIKLIDSIIDRGSKTMANRVLAHVRRFFNWCIERDLIETSPAEKLVKPTQEKSRDRALSEKEIKELLNACDKEGYPYGHLVKFLLVTAQRRDEASTMLWEDIDFDKKLWILPREKTKSDRRHEVPLSPLAIHILKDAKTLCIEGAQYVFTTEGNKPFSGFSVAKKRLDKTLNEARTANGVKSHFPEWRIHDLRRTAASGMAQLGVAPHIVEKILNHSSGVISGVAAVYNRYDYRAETTAAHDRWSQTLKNLNFT
jgi:integrase